MPQNMCILLASTKNLPCNGRMKVPLNNSMLSTFTMLHEIVAHITVLASPWVIITYVVIMYETIEYHKVENIP